MACFKDSVFECWTHVSRLLLCSNSVLCLAQLMSRDVYLLPIGLYLSECVVEIRRRTLVGKAKAGMVHSVSGWTRGVQVKLWDPLRTRAIPERLEVCSRQGTIQIHVYLYLTLPLGFSLLAPAVKLEWSEYRHRKETFCVTLISRYYTLIEQSSQSCNITTHELPVALWLAVFVTVQEERNSALNMLPCVKQQKKLIRRWDSERELFTTTSHTQPTIKFTSLMESTHVHRCHRRP